MFPTQMNVTFQTYAIEVDQIKCKYFMKQHTTTLSASHSLPLSFSMWMCILYVYNFNLNDCCCSGMVEILISVIYFQWYTRIHGHDSTDMDKFYGARHKRDQNKKKNLEFHLDSSNISIFAYLFSFVKWKREEFCIHFSSEAKINRIVCFRFGWKHLFVVGTFTSTSSHKQIDSKSKNNTQKFQKQQHFYAIDGKFYLNLVTVLFSVWF